MTLHTNTLTGNAVYVTDERKIHTKKIGCPVRSLITGNICRCNERMQKNSWYAYVSNMTYEAYMDTLQQND